MKHRALAATAVLVATSSAAYAVGLDRSGQSINPLFATGNHLEFSLGYTNPTLDGPGVENVAENFLIWGGAVKYEFSDQLSGAVIVDEPFGADTFYDSSPVFSALGGTGATVDSFAITALARYKFNDNWSVHGGLRYQEISAVVTLGGLAFNANPTVPTPGVQSGVNGFRGEFASGGDLGFVIGGAYEIPEIALRIAVTYNSSTTHDLDTVESGLPFLNGASVTEVETPESLNIDFQTGIAPDTLLFGNFRYARYSDTVVSPSGFSTLTGNPLTDLEDGFDFSIGVGRRFNEKWSGSVSAGFTTVGDDNLVSPLSPNNGSQFVAVGAKYDVNDAFAIAGGVRYTSLGDAIAAPGGNPVQAFESNDAVSVGLRLEYKF